eukprot:5820949-Amphidinium_carterae.1
MHDSPLPCQSEDSAAELEARNESYGPTKFDLHATLRLEDHGNSGQRAPRVLQMRVQPTRVVNEDFCQSYFNLTTQHYRLDENDYSINSQNISC